MEFWRWVKCQWDRAAALVAFVAGLVSLLLGWIGISGVTLPAEQIPYLASDTVFGLFALGTAATLWLSADLRDEWRKLEDIHQTMLEEAENRPAGGMVDAFVRSEHFDVPRNGSSAAQLQPVGPLGRTEL
jgi:hypothetical protein